MKKALFTAMFLVACLAQSGCYKPYMMEKSIVIQPWQTAVLVPLEADADKQINLPNAQVDPKTGYKYVSATRVILPQRFNQTGRWGWQGNWIVTIDPVIVNRSPVALLWTADAASGTNAANEAIWLESQDSIAFSIPFAIAGYVKSEDFLTYLHLYSRNGLKNILNTEGRNKVIEAAAEFSNSYPLNELRKKKAEINTKVQGVIIPYFANKGITITFVGIGGNSSYRNPEIATSIDSVFIAQQLKNTELAKSVASKLHQQVTEKEGEAEAAKAREMAKGPSQSAQIMAEAQRDVDTKIGEARAQAISNVNEALKEASTSELFLKNMQLDVEALRIESWNGEVPMITSGENDFVPKNYANK